MMHHKKCGAGWVVWALLIIGAINWGLVGIAGFLESNWNVVNLLFGNWPPIEWAIYILIGIAGVTTLFGGCRCKTCRSCENCGAAAGAKSQDMSM